MEVLCQRCGVALNPTQVFCHNCGAPQLQIEPADIVSTEESGGATAAAPSRDIAWKAAIRAALIVFLPAALLSSVVNFSCLWVIGGGMAAVALYRRRSNAILDTRSGLRIGLVVGLLVALTTSALDAVSMVVQRFGTHSARDIDERWNATLQPMIQQMQQSYEQASHSNPESAAQIVSMIHFWQSADGKAAGVLMAYGLLATGIIVFSAVGGALGSRIFAARPIRFRRS
jgi:hypothetical protein